MTSPTNNKESDFYNALLNLCKERNKAGLKNDPIVKPILEGVGYKAIIHILYAIQYESRPYKFLRKANRLDLTIQYFVLDWENKCATGVYPTNYSIFTPDQCTIAKKCLLEYGNKTYP